MFEMVILELNLTVVSMHKTRVGNLSREWPRSFKNFLPESQR